jgi:hypothetical protein
MRHRYTARKYEQLSQLAANFVTASGLHSLVIVRTAVTVKSEACLQAVQHEYLVPIKGLRTAYDRNWPQRLHDAWTGNAYVSAALGTIHNQSIPYGGDQVDRIADICGGDGARFFQVKGKLVPSHHIPVSQLQTLVGSHPARASPKQVCRSRLKA